MRNTLAKAARATGATLLALGLAFSVTNVAHAASASYTQGSGSIEGGYYRGSYRVTPKESYISMYTINKKTYCSASQDNKKPSYSYSSIGANCTASQTGNANSGVDYVYFNNN